ncbi:MAG: AMP-binding protein [Fidelibacterota bacterium]
MKVNKKLDRRLLTLTSEELTARCRESSKNERLPGWERQIYSFVSQWIDDSPEIILKTSGSTGRPRELKVSKSRMENSARLTGCSLGLKQGDRTFLCLPMDYIAGKMMVVRALVLKLKLVAVKPTSHPVDLLNQTVELAAMVPLQLRNSLDSTSIRLIDQLLVGGGPISPDLEDSIQELPIRVVETYGMTETLTHVAYRYLNGSRRSKLFQALNGIEFKQTPEGCLIIQAPELNPDIVVTRDLVELENSHSFCWLGRADNVINSGGIKIIPERVEQKMANHLKSRPYFIAGVPDLKLGQRVVLIVEGKADLPRDYEIGRGLEQFEKPRDIFYIKKFCYTDSGKIKRKETINLLKKIQSW